MWHNLAQLPRYRGLIQSLVARELKARYRGSVLGFFWSFVNPLLLLSIYSFVFTKILPNDDKDTAAVRGVHVLRPAAVDVVLRVAARGAGSLIAGGNLIKKVLFPGRSAADRQRARRTWCTSASGLLILAGFMVWQPALPGLAATCLVSRSSCWCSSCSRSGWRCSCRR